MSFKRYLIAIGSVCVFIILYHWVVDRYILGGMYVETAKVWRASTEMAMKIPLMIFFVLLLSIWVVFAFTRIYKEMGVVNGLLFGIYFGVFAGILTASWYLWLMIPAKLALGWFLTSFVEGVGIGLVLGLICRVNTQPKIL